MAVIRNKNSQVKDKKPTATDLQYGELTVNCHADSPAVHFRDTENKIVSLTPAVSANDGAIKISGKNGITATGDDASANQAGDTEKVLSVDESWLGTWVSVNIPDYGVKPGDGAIKISGSDGITASGTDAKANQSGDTEKKLSLDKDWLNTWLTAELNQGTGEDGSGPPLVGNGDIKISALKDGGITATGDDAKANQNTGTDKILSVDATVIRTTGDQSMSDRKEFTGTIGLTNKSVIEIHKLDDLPMVDDDRY